MSLFHNIEIFLKIIDAKENSKRKTKKIHRLVNDGALIK